ncbi:MAG: hypothetical protein QNJ65_07375 [Xenococcaceae cyanobacterium MO_234.B1]|nr:hypothetical protein [Xenococcaceae cyanobacterium MO_234.B1]
MTTGDINPDELWIGGKIAKNFELKNAHINQGKKKTISELKKVISKNLGVTESKPTSNR